jgi:type II secretory pathway predicted ATPase ExeA
MRYFAVSLSVARKQMSRVRLDAVVVYITHYRLQSLPFELTTDPTYLFLAPGHREALANLEYGLASGKALTVLTGEPGTGKTTLLRAALGSEQCRHVRCLHVNNPALTREEFLTTLALLFNVDGEAARSKPLLLDRIERSLRERRGAGGMTALIVDEAQALSTDLLEEIRLLANIETATEKLLPLVLSGQPELAARLDEPSLRQLKQRVALRCEVPAFALPETAAYIATRIRAAGGRPERLFTREAVRLIHGYARGIPRTINVICDNALVTGMALDRQTVDSEMVLEVCRDFALTANSEAATHSAADSGDGVDAQSPAAEQQDSAHGFGRLGESLGLRMFRSR